jgi:hypothetical protein
MDDNGCNERRPYECRPKDMNLPDEEKIFSFLMLQEVLGG